MTPYSYNANRFANRVRIHGKWLNYLSNGLWRSIEAAFQDDSSAFEFSKGPFRFHAPQYATGKAVLEVNNEWDIWSKSRITSPAMVFEVIPENVYPVAGRIDENNPSQVWYDNAWGPGLSLRYTIWYGRALRCTREAVIDPAQCPRGRDLHASWLVRSPKALTLVNGTRPKNPDGSDWTGAAGDTALIPENGAAIHYFDGQLDPYRGSGFKGPKVWYWKADGTLVTATATVTATIVDAETIRLVKTIKQETIDTAAAEGSLVFCDDTQTFYPDPNAEITTFDGRTGAKHQMYDATNYHETVALAGSSTYSNDSQTTSYVGFHFGGGAGGYQLHRFFALFDLSSIAGNTISAITQGWTVAGNATSKTFRVTGATTASNTGYSVADHYNTYINNDVAYSDDNPGLTPNASEVTMNYNATGIADAQTAADGTGILKTCLRRANDNLNAPADGQHDFDQPTVYTAESAYDPSLLVTYGAAGAGAGGRSHLKRHLLEVR